MRGTLCTLICFTILLVLEFVATATETTENVKKKRNGPMLLRLYPKTQAQLDFLDSLKHAKRGLKLQVWRHADDIDRHVDVWISWRSYQEFKEIINQLDMQFEVLSQDIYKTVGHRNISLKGIETFDSYFQDYEELVGEMLRLSAIYNNSVRMETIGKSYQGRSIYAMWVQKNSRMKKDIMVVNCGMHSREWLAISSCQYVLRKLIFDQNYDGDIKRMLNHYDVVMMPLLNPDGYIFSKNARFRLWRKSRSKTSIQNCLGVDLNRNFAYRWGGGGSSADACEDIFCGTQPFSESETLSLARFLYKHRRRIISYCDVHTYGQMWMSPWGYTKVFARDSEIQKRAMEKIQTAIKTENGVTYRVGRSSSVLYQTSGDSLDWVYGRLGVAHTYGIELRPALRIPDGFRYTRHAIVLAGNDLLVGLKALARFIVEDSNAKF